MQPYQSPYPTEDDTLYTPHTPTLDDDVSQQITGIMQPLPGSNASRSPSSSIKILPMIALALCLVLAIVLYFVWRQQPAASSPSSPPITANNPPSPSSNTDGSTIQVYVVGQVKHPGIYTVPSDARVYQAIQAAGGPLPGADLVTLNLATHVSDGQEIYVPRVGETAPTTKGTSTSGTATASNGPLVNINTASAAILRQQLHVSSKTAQAIIDYRTQHGPYTSVDQLANAVSKTIYNRIKNMVTVS